MDDMTDEDLLVKVWFKLIKDESGWPPVDSEGLWAMPIGEGHFRLDNVPWFVRGVAFADEVEALDDGSGTLWASRVIQWSGRHVIRIVPSEDLGNKGPAGGSRALKKALTQIEELGVVIEAAGPPSGWYL